MHNPAALRGTFSGSPTGHTETRTVSVCPGPRESFTAQPGRSGIVSLRVFVPPVITMRTGFGPVQSMSGTYCVHWQRFGQFGHGNEQFGSSAKHGIERSETWCVSHPHAGAPRRYGPCKIPAFARW